MAVFNPSGLERGHTTLGFYGNKTRLETPGPGSYDPFPLLNPPGFRMGRPTALPDRMPGSRCVNSAVAPSPTFRIRLQKTGGKKIGLRYRTKTLRVEQVLDVGLLGEWNSGNPEDAVLPGDYIVEVNGKKIASDGSKSLIKELTNKTTLDIGISSSETMQFLRWQPEPMSLSRPQREQPLISYASAIFWDWPAQRRKFLLGPKQPVEQAMPRRGSGSSYGLQDGDNYGGQHQSPRLDSVAAVPQLPQLARSRSVPNPSVADI